MIFTFASTSSRLRPAELRFDERLAYARASSGSPRRGIGSVAATTIASYDATTRHNIPAVFWRYMREQPVDWLYAFGHQITEPYWVSTRLNDKGVTNGK